MLVSGVSIRCYYQVLLSGVSIRCIKHYSASQLASGSETIGKTYYILYSLENKGEYGTYIEMLVTSK